jgi:hypothetical protein
MRVFDDLALAQMSCVNSFQPGVRRAECQAQPRRGVRGQEDFGVKVGSEISPKLPLNLPVAVWNNSKGAVPPGWLVGRFLQSLAARVHKTATNRLITCPWSLVSMQPSSGEGQKALEVWTNHLSIHCARKTKYSICTRGTYDQVS